MTRNATYALGTAALLGTFALGFMLGEQAGRAGRIAREAPPAPTADLPAPPPGAPGVPLDTSQQITTLQQLLAQDPKSARAWVQLGNLYFDTNQAQRSIDAYARALELEPANPDVLTDQGVMYRAVGAYDKALADFEKANALDPKHVQSLYNIGVVYAFDLKDAAKAERAWNRLIEQAPDSEQAGQARQAMAQLPGHR